MKNQYWFGEWRGGPLTGAGARELCRRAARLRGRAADYPLDKVLRLLGRMRRCWADPGYGPRRRAERLLPGVTGFSRAMVRRGLEELCWTFDPELLRRKLDSELPGHEGLGSRRWEPLGAVLHVLAGNVFVGAAGSLVEGLLTRNVNMLKMSSSEGVFLPLLLSSLRENDDDGVISRCLAAVAFSQSQADVIEAFKRNADGIVVWGGEGAVRGWRDGLPARARLIVFGPKLSFAVVTRRALAEASPELVADRLAREASIWDQNACTAPQACYVEGRAAARRLLEALPGAFAQAARDLPPGEIETDAAVEIQKLRGIFEVAEARGRGAVRMSPRGLDWTAVLDPDSTLSPSPLHRTLRIIPFGKIAEVAARAAALRGYVQSVGVAAAPDEGEGVAECLAQAGALRIVELGRMAEGEIDDPHDGARDLPQFMRLVLRRLPGRRDWTAAEKLLPEARRRLIDARLRRLIDAARQAPFYARRLKGLRVETVADLPEIPPLSREEMERNMPPRGEGLRTLAWSGGYVSRSGGSTGEPKFSVYDRRDWEAMIAHGAEVFRALGLKPSDRLGNFMLAGDLYGSFVSFDHVNHRLGLASFGFAGNSSPETFVKVRRQFGLNAVEGIPPHLLPFLRRAKALDGRLRLQTVVYAGSPMSAADRDWLRRELGARRIASVIGANDGGQLGYQCARMRGARHHAVDDFNWIEIVDERGRPVPEGRTGRILITSLLKLAYPLIRYELGDAGRLVPGTCPCGRPARVFELLGRCDDVLAVGNMNVRHRDFAAALKNFPVTAVQIAARSSAAGEALIVRAETPARPSAQLQARLRRALLDQVAKLGQRLADGGLAELGVELHRTGALPRNPRTGKLKNAVDERR
ncbi:MAG: acyl-CoA reductase [Elusimicrobia bacterium]|nr:acyl-CoA reductase [Elusimicrobiota bacterium]